MAERATEKSWQEGLLVARAAEEAARASRQAPAAFAAADSPPLDPRPSAPAMDVPGALGAPQQINAPEQPGPALAELRPAPPQTRDPREPFKDYAGAIGEADRSDWRPTEPLTTITSTENFRGSTGWASTPSAAGGAALPPPTGDPVVATEPRTPAPRRLAAQLPQRPTVGLPPNSLSAQVRPANSPFPSNPYASGLYVPPPPPQRRSVPMPPVNRGGGNPPFPPPARGQRRD